MRKGNWGGSCTDQVFLMVEYHPHCCFQIIKLLFVYLLDLIIRNFGVSDLLKQRVCCQVFNPEAKSRPDFIEFQVLVDLAQVFPECWIIIVFDTVIRPSLKLFGDLGPFVAVSLMQTKNLSLLVLRYWILFDVRVQMVVPSLSALLASPSRDLIFIFQQLGY